MSQMETSTSPESRRSKILGLLERKGELSIEVLADRYSVSGMTIRRDLQELVEAGRVIRTHGGAAPAQRISFEFKFLERTQHNAEQKRQIAELAVQRVKPGQTVMLDSSTTTLAIANHLAVLDRLTVITTSLPIASALFGREGIEVIILGGTLRKDSPDLCGALTDTSLDLMRADIAFIGADAIDDEGYIYNASTEIARMLQRMASAAAEVYAVADASKIGRQELMRFSRLADWSGLITDSTLDRGMIERLQQNQVRVIQPGTEVADG